jgi:hypothetical protein
MLDIAAVADHNAVTRPHGRQRVSIPTDHSRPRAYRFVVALLRPLLMIFTKRRWSGQENLPTEGGFVVVTNHYSHLDPFVFGHFLVDHGFSPRFLGKVEVFRIPVVGWILTRADQIRVHRESGRAIHAFRSPPSRPCGPARSSRSTLRAPSPATPTCGRCGGRPALPGWRWRPAAPSFRSSRGAPTRSSGPIGTGRTCCRARRWSCTPGPPVELDDLRGLPLTAEVLQDATDRIMAALTTDLEGVRGERAPGIRFDPRAAGVTPIGRPRPLKEAS